MGGDFIEEENFGFREENASESEELLFAGAEVFRVFMENSVVFFRKVHDDIVDAGGAASSDLIRVIGVDEIEIFADGGVEDERCLRDDADICGINGGSVIFYIYIVEEDFSGFWFFVTEEKMEERGFSGAGRADQSGEGVGLRGESDVF